MPPRSRAEDERLIAAYHEAALRISRELQTASPNRRAVILQRIESLLSQLDELSAKYLTEQLPLHFKSGSTEAVSQLRSLGFKDIDATFGTIHLHALQALVDDSKLKFANALEGVRREASSRISQATKQQVITELLQNEIAGGATPSARVKRIFLDQGITAIRSASRSWSLEDYASMLTNTVLAEAHNTGALTRYASNGVEFVEVIERGNAPDRTCEFMRGKIVFIGDRRLQPPFHPNCMGGIKPFLGKPDAPIMSPDDHRIPADVRKTLLKR